MTNAFQLNVGRNFKCDAKTLFNAIGEGMLLKNTASTPEKTSIDFKIGGKYRSECDSGEETLGEFLEIDPHSKIVFTWNKNPKAGPSVSSTVTVMLTEAGGATTLQLRHEGLPSAEQHKSHADGWSHVLKAMYNQLGKHFAKIENNSTGLDVNFSLVQTIQAPVEKVFAAVQQDSQLQKYFKVKMSGPFEKGKSVTWDFTGHPTFTLKVHEVIPNEMIKFQWGKTHVVFSFSSPDAGKTQMRIHCTGFPADQEGMNDAFSECHGWTEFMIKLMHYTQAA